MKITEIVSRTLSSGKALSQADKNIHTSQHADFFKLTQLAVTGKDNARAAVENLQILEKQTKDETNTILQELNIAIKYLMCRCLLITGETAKCQELLCDPDNKINSEEKQIITGRLLINSGNRQEALLLLENTLKEHPNNWQALALIGALGGENSEDYFKQSIEIYPYQADALRNRAAVRLSRGLVKEATQDLYNSLLIRPGLSASLELIHPLLMSEGSLIKLGQLYESLPKWAWTPRLHGEYWNLLRQLGKSREAWELAKDLINIKCADLDLLLCAGSAAQAAGQKSIAREIYRRIASSNSHLLASRALNNLALMAINDKDISQALSLIQQARELDHKDIDLRLHEAELLFQQGEQTICEECLNELNNINEQMSTEQRQRWVSSKARLLMRRGLSSDALPIATSLRIQSPKVPDHWLLEANLLKELNKVNQAINLVKEAISITENPNSLQEALIGYLSNQGRTDEAEEMVEEWLLKDPKNKELLAMNAGISMDRGNFEEAENRLKKLRDVDDYFGGKALAKFLIERDKSNDAFTIINSLIEKYPTYLSPYELGAISLVNLQRPIDAINLLQKAYKVDPYRLDILTMLVNMMINNRMEKEAMQIIEKEFSKRKSIPLLKLAIKLVYRQGDWAKGMAMINTLDRNKKGSYEVQIMKSRICRHMGNSEEALNITYKLAESSPSNLKYRNKYIQELLSQEKFKEAQRQAHILSKELPDTPQRLIQLVNLLSSADARQEAISILQTEMSRWPNHTELPWLEIKLLNKLSMFSEAQSKLAHLVEISQEDKASVLERALLISKANNEYDMAKLYANQWIDETPKNLEPYYALYDIHVVNGEFSSALELLDRIRKINSKDKRLDNLEAALYIKQCRYASAIHLLDRCIERNPINTYLKDQRLAVRVTSGDFNSFDAELEELDRLRGFACYQEYSSYFFNINCHPNWSSQRVFNFHNDWYKNGVEKDLPPIPSFSHIVFDPQRRLKIGYVSGDFKRHAVAYFSEPLLIEHDRDQFEVYAFATHCPTRLDDVTKRFKTYVHHWIDVYSLTKEELYRKIRALKIDILIDLSGHSSNNRLQVFCLKPAPIQISAVFGSGQTTGIKRIDYLLCDQVSVPPEHSQYLVEERAEIPITGFPYKPGDDYTDPTPLPCMRKTNFTFGCITRALRANSQVCIEWGKILSKCPNAQIVFDHYSYMEEEVQERYRRLLETAGAKSNQVTFRNTRPYWKLFDAVDLLLDPWPAGSGTVGTDALWMNRLTLTLKSRPMMGTFMTAQLAALDLESQFSCLTEEMYIKRAVDFANTQEGRNRLSAASMGTRQKLKESPLMNYEEYGKITANLYRKLWINRCLEEQSNHAN